MEKKTLIIVDFQRDFCNPQGSLYVKGSEEAQAQIMAHIRADDSIDQIIFTLDWHPTDHCSFADNGGQWPRHCVNYTIGAGIPGALLRTAYHRTKNVSFFLKGDNPKEEEYGAFNHIAKVHTGTTKIDDNGEAYEDFRFETSNSERTCYCRIENKTVEVCGIALDYCVKNSIQNLVDFNLLVGENKLLNISLLKNMSPSIGDPESTYSILTEKSVLINDVKY